MKRALAGGDLVAGQHLGRTLGISSAWECLLSRGVEG
jgi:hypothetical protein